MFFKDENALADVHLKVGWRSTLSKHLKGTVEDASVSSTAKAAEVDDEDEMPEGTPWDL